MVTTLGTILGTTLGTELGGMQDVAGFDSRLLYALTNLSGSNWYETQAGGGEVGTAAGFGFVVLCRLHQSVASASRAIADNFYTSPIEGWTLNSTGTNNSVIAAFSSGAAASISTPAVTLTPSDSGRILALVGQHTGAGATARLSVFRGSYVSQAITGYTAAVARKMAIGKRANVGNIPADGVDVIGKLTFRGVPSDAQIAAVLDAARNGMDLPTAFVGATLTHRISLRDVLAGLDLPVIDGQTAPASLPDTVTAASIDAMARQGSPTVRVIDPSADGRKSYGVINGGPSGASGLATAAGAGIRGSSTALTVGLTAYLSSSGVEMLAGATNSSDAGWGLYVQSTLRFTVRDGSNVAKTLTWTIAPGHHRVVGRVDNANQTLWVDGVQVATQACVGHTPPSGALAMGLGSRPDFTLPAANSNAYGLTGGAFAATDNEIAAWSQSVERTGRIQQIRPGSDEHLYDLTADVVANGGPENGIPATVQDRIGTDHLTKVGGPVVAAGNRLAGFASTVYAQTAGAAAPGNTGGFNAAVLYEHGTTVTLEGLFACANSGATNGFAIALHSTDRLFSLIGNGTAATVLGDSPQTYLTVGLHHIAINYNGTQAKIFVDGVLKQTVAVAYAVSTSPASIGSMVSGANPARPHGVYGAAYGATSATDGEIATAAAASIAAGSIVGVSGKTDKRWSAVDDVIEAGGKVPALLKERVSGVDHMAVVGAPLQVAQRAERVWSYETTPILYGATGLSDTVYYHSNVGSGDNSLAFGGTLVWIPRAGPSATRALLSGLLITPTRGWDIRTTGTNALVSALIANGANAGQTSPTISLTPFHGKICVFSFQWDGTSNRLRAYLNRVEGGTGSAITGHAIGDGSVRLGATSGATGSPGTDNDPLGFCLWTGLASLAQVQAQHDAILAEDGHVQPMPGVTQTMSVNLTLDARANGNVLGATLVDRQGGNNLTATGSPGTVAQYARAFGF